MIYRSIVAVTFFIVSGCGRFDFSDQEFDREWRGTINFTAGEFQLYEIGIPNDTADGCVSGTLPVEMQRQVSKEYDLASVTVIGRAVRWPSEGLLAYLEYHGGRVSNECGGEYVIFASSMTRN